MIALIPSKGRPDILKKCALPMLSKMGIPYLVNIEVGERESYGEIPNAIYSVNNIGLVGALENLKCECSEDLIFKIDDDVLGFTGQILEMLPKFEKAFLKHEKLGAIAFPYDHEFYYGERAVFSHYNARLQTCYIIRKDLFCAGGIFDPFEDFCHFISLRTKGFFTLLSPTTKIRCKPVGETPGGLNDGSRNVRSMAAIKKIQAHYPTLKIGVKNRPEKNWKFEPDFSKEPLLKKKKI